MRTFVPKTDKIWEDIKNIAIDSIIFNTGRELELFRECTDNNKLGMYISKSFSVSIFARLQQIVIEKKDKKLLNTFDAKFVYECCVEHIKTLILRDVFSVETNTWAKISQFIQLKTNWSYIEIIKKLNEYMKKICHHNMYEDTDYVMICHLDCTTFIINEIIRKFGYAHKEKLPSNFISDVIIKYIEYFFSEFNIILPDVNNNLWMFLCDYIKGISIDKSIFFKLEKTIYEYYNIIGINECNYSEFTKYLWDNLNIEGKISNPKNYMH